MTLNRLVVVFGSLLLVLSTAGISFSASKNFQLPGFKNLFRPTQERNQPGGFSMVQDPLDSENKKKVFKFSIVPGPCVKDECEQQSARATVQQSAEAKQPKEYWYGWDMYFVEDFPFAAKQIRGHQIFAEFKDQHQCQLVALTTNPHSYDEFLSWSMEKPTGKAATQFGGDCVPVFEKQIAKIKDLVGKWHRFELFVRWSKEGDGKFLMYVDGQPAVEYEGITCFECNKMNYFLFGNYLCCTTGTESVAPATVYYRYVSAAKSREKLVWQ